MTQLNIKKKNIAKCTYRKYLVLLHGKAADRSSGGFALCAAWREEQQSVKEARQTIAKIITLIKYNKNSPALYCRC